jgi:small subunit ribosomal protein S14
MSEKRNIRDHKRRLLAAKYELRRKLYKAFCKDSDLPSDMRDKLRYKLSKLPRNSSFARVRNRCISTGRPRSIYEFFRISRIVFRGLASRTYYLFLFHVYHKKYEGKEKNFVQIYTLKTLFSLSHIHLRKKY